jgi:hypothetical protein
MCFTLQYVLLLFHCPIAICFMSFGLCYVLINFYVVLIYSLYVLFLVLFVLFSILCLLRFCMVLFIVSAFVYSCLFPIFIQVCRPVPPGGNPVAINKYRIISHHNKNVFKITCLNILCFNLT